MPARTFFHISRRTVQVVLATLLLLVVVFFALTRTQVGRDELRDQVEQQFDDAFAGRLAIDKLEGNLVHDLYATGVRLYDDQDRLVAEIDSVVAQPRWKALLGREVRLRALTLYRPRVQMQRDTGGTWNLADALRRRGSPDTTSTADQPVSLTVPAVRIVDGAVTTQNTGTAPQAVQKGWLFNYADTRLHGLNAEAAIDWRPGVVRQIDLDALSGTLAGPQVTVQSLQGQVVLNEYGLALNDVRLRADETDLQFSVSAENLVADAEPALDVRLAESRIDWDAVRRLVPRLPLRDQTTLAGRVHGPLSGLVVDRLVAERGASRLEATGTLLDLPQTADFEVRLREAVLDARDVEAVYPPADVTALERLGRARLDLYARGVADVQNTPAPPLRLRTELTLQSEAGRLEGTVSLNQQSGRPLAYTADLSADDLNLSRLFPEDAAPRTRITGRVELGGQGTTRQTAAGDVRLRLAGARLAGRRLDSLAADLAVERERLTGTIRLRQGLGTLYAAGTADLGRARPTYQLEATARRLDLGPLLLRDSLATSLNATMTLDAAGDGQRALAGTLALALDTSTVTRGGAERLVPATELTLALAEPGTGAPRLRLTGDALALTVTGEAPVAPARALIGLWGPALAEAVRAQIGKPYAARAAEAGSAAPDGTSPPPPSGEARAQVQQALARVGLPQGLDLAADLRVKRPEVLSALLLPLGALTPGLTARFSLAADANRLETSGRVRTDSLRLGRVRTEGAAGTFEARATMDAPLAETLTLTAEARADTLRIGEEIGFRDPVAAVSYYDRTAELQLATGSDAQAGPLRLEAGLDLLADRNRLTLRSILLETGPYTWTNPSARFIDLYADAIDIPGLRLVSEVPEAQRVQTVRLRGTFSSAPGDTLTVDAGDILLSSLSNLASLRRPIGGLFNGRLALTGGGRQPELTGAVEVERLSFDRRLLGHLSAESRYVPGSPEVALEAQLRPSRRDSLALSPGDAPTRNEESALRVAGTFRLPRLDDSGRFRYDPEAAGALDLRLDVERARLFFFEYIFPGIIANADGTVAGQGTIGGTFRDPLFQADLNATGGRFEVPRFGLAYGLEGPITVDQRGIHLREATLSDPGDGTAAVSGSILFNDYEYFSFDLAAQLDALQIIDVERSRDLPFYGDIRASGDVSLTGPIYGATLRAPNARTTADSELFLPIDDAEGAGGGGESGFILFADSTGQLPDLDRVTRRANVLAERPAGERTFLDGMEMDLNITAPQGSTVHLVFDPLLGDVINAVGSGRIQLQRQEGAFSTFGTFEATSGDYLFTAGDVFQRRFEIEGGAITWDGPPANALLDLTASYRTRASTAGLQGIGSGTARIPVVVRLGITERVRQPEVDLSLAIDRDTRGFSDDYAVTAVESILNQGERETEYATSVLLTNTFLLTTDLPSGGRQEIADTGNRLAFNSVSQLVTSQLNRYLSEALPNVDFSFGVQGENANDLDVIYGVALRLLDERLVIRGEGVVESGEDQAENQGLEGEFVVELRLSSSVSVEAFYRREGSILTEQALTSTTGAGLSYQTQFPTWRRLAERLLGWLLPGSLTSGEPPAPTTPDDAVARGDAPRDDAARDEDPAESAPDGP